MLISLFCLHNQVMKFIINKYILTCKFNWVFLKGCLDNKTSMHGKKVVFGFDEKTKVIM